jgi:hypothetical protein
MNPGIFFEKFIMALKTLTFCCCGVREAVLLSELSRLGELSSIEIGLVSFGCMHLIIIPQNVSLQTGFSACCCATIKAPCLNGTKPNSKW